MPSQRPRWGSGALSSLLTAGIMLTVVGCAHITPLAPNPGPPATAAGPPMRVTLQRLRSPFALRAARVSPLAPGGGCPAGYAALAVDTQYCFEEFGPTATVTAAGVSGFTKIPPAGQSGFLITVFPRRSVSAEGGHRHGR